MAAGEEEGVKAMSNITKPDILKAGGQLGAPWGWGEGKGGCCKDLNYQQTRSWTSLHPTQPFFGRLNTPHAILVHTHNSGNWSSEGF